MAFAADLDYSDPCATAAELRKALLKLAAGEQVAITEFEVGTGTRRRMEFHKGDVKVLRELLAEAEAKCRAISGRGPARTVRFSTSKGV